MLGQQWGAEGLPPLLPLTLSPDGASSHVARVSATAPETWKPGVAGQYALQLAKLSSGMAVVSMPAYFSLVLVCRSSPSPHPPHHMLTRNKDSAELGKKYLAIPYQRPTSTHIARDVYGSPRSPHYYEDNFGHCTRRVIYLPRMCSCTT
jgi:hypothetical protein